MTIDSPTKKTALHSIHVELGAKMVPFAGYDMPVYYGGIVSEHNRVRSTVGLFDVSHMGEVIVSGANALSFVQKITINDASKLTNGQAQYSAMCLPEGGIVDDLLVYRLEADEFLLVINASNIEKDVAWMRENLIGGVDLDNVSDDYTLLALQGPESIKTLSKLTEVQISDIPFYHFVRGEVSGVPTIISRTGYTGELGFELYFSSDPKVARGLWTDLMNAGKEFEIEPVGLGARDTLRLEMGYCLYGNDITSETNPIEAGLGWITKLDKDQFVGKDAISHAKESGTKRKLIGFELKGRGIPRQGYPIMFDDEEIGIVTSGTMSPILSAGIGMGYVDKEYSKKGSELSIRIREKDIPATVVRPPFITKS